MMRYTLVAVWVIGALSSKAFAQSSPYMATVTATSASLRVGPSDQYPVTATLKPGDPVWVDHEDENGWLAVQDPPGRTFSVSWVSVQFVSSFDTAKPTPQNVTVEEATSLRPGQLGDFKPLADFGKTKVPAGTILTAIGGKVTVNGKSWYPVVPPAGDFRYIPKQMVKADRTINTSFTVKESTSASPPAVIPAGSSIPSPPAGNTVIGPPILPVAPSGPTPSTASPPPAPPKPVVNNPLWAQAETAEQDGRLDDAEKLYFQLARLMNEPGGDHDIANLCYTRIHSLREKKRAVPPTATARTALVTAPAGAGPLPPPPPSPPPPDEPLTGTLVRAKIDYDGHVGKTYVLERDPGVPIVYVIAAPGVDLERCVSRRVKLYGKSSKHRDLTMPLVTATRADAVPDK